MLENSQPLATVYATHALLEKKMLVHHVNPALWVDSVAVKQSPAVKTAPKVFTKTKQAHRIACLVCPGTSKF